MSQKKIIVFFIFLRVFRNFTDDQNNNIPECGKSENLFTECFKNLSHAEQMAMVNVKIPISKEEISSRCSVFERGMKCTDDYLNRCLAENLRKIVNNDLSGAKYFYKILCNDKNFQKDYLRHKECLYFIQNDWDDCAKEYRDVLKQETIRIKSEPNRNIHYMQLCCVKYGYENCVFNSARYKCRKDSSMFARELARILTSEKQFDNCDKIDKSICSSSWKLNNHVKILHFSILMYFLSCFVNRN